MKREREKKKICTCILNASGYFKVDNRACFMNTFWNHAIPITFLSSSRLACITQTFADSNCYYCYYSLNYNIYNWLIVRLTKEKKKEYRSRRIKNSFFSFSLAMTSTVSINIQVDIYDNLNLDMRLIFIVEFYCPATRFYGFWIWKFDFRFVFLKKPINYL